MDLYDYAARLDLAYSVLERAEGVSRQDKENVRRFVEHLKALGVSKGRRAKYVYHLKVSLECLGKSAKAAERSDIERLMVRATESACPSGRTACSSVSSRW